MNFPPVPPTNLRFMTDRELDDEKFVDGCQVLLDFADGLLEHSTGIVDIGCGYGRLGYALRRKEYSGAYAGFDILKRQIDWLTENFTPHAPNFTFHHIDILNERYNPKGQLQADEVDFKKDLSFVPDFIMLYSVFTHMYEGDIESYLRAIKETMGPKTMSICSIFIIDSKVGAYPFPHKINDHCYIYNQEHPLHAIAYSEEWVRHILDKIGFDYEIKYAFQDQLRLSLPQ